MLTGYWSIDAFIVANLALWVFVAVIYGYHQQKGGGMLDDRTPSHQPKE